MEKIKPVNKRDLIFTYWKDYSSTNSNKLLSEARNCDYLEL